MPIQIVMPKLSDNMEAGTIVRWLKKPGQEVGKGEPLAEVETDKADVEVEAEEAGTVLEFRVAEGQSAAVGEVIAILAAPGQETWAGKTDGGPGASAERATSTNGGEGEGAPERPAEPAKDERQTTDSARPAPRPARRSEGEAPSQTSGSGFPRPLVREGSAAPGARSDGGARTVRASPLAWRLAADEGIDLTTLEGSGPGGRIVKRDVEEARARKDALPKRNEGLSGEKPSAPPGVPTERAGGRVEGASRMRLTIARRMTEAKRDIPHFYLKVDIDMGDSMRVRESIRQSGAIPYLTVTHLVVKAMVQCLERHPRVNASWLDDGSVEFHGDVNVGIAVALEDGLIVPVLHQAQRMTLAEIAEGATALIERARNGKFSGNDLAGSTISLSNVGILDVDELVAVINPPHAAVLATAAVKDRPVVREGGLAVARTMRATLSCDHRVLNGVEGAEFLQDVKRVLENPAMLLLE